MPYIEMAVPLDITSEPLLAVPTLPAEEIPGNYSLDISDRDLFDMKITREGVTLHSKVQLHNKKFKGTSVIKIHGSRPLRPQNKIIPMLKFRLFK
jgi:hypothetical protein